MTIRSATRCLGAAVLLAFLLAAETAQGQAANRAGSAAAPALRSLEYLVGEWEVRTFVRADSGRFEETPGTSFFRARFLRDGLSMLAEFYEQRRDGFYGIHIITHDPDRGLVHSYFNAHANRRLEFEGRFENGEYSLQRRGGYGGGDHLFRETDSEITERSFVKRTYRSDEDGATWLEGDYCFRFDRIR